MVMTPNPKRAKARRSSQKEKRAAKADDDTALIEEAHGVEQLPAKGGAQKSLLTRAKVPRRLDNHTS